jgi:hypothetical protein
VLRATLVAGALLWLAACGDDGPRSAEVCIAVVGPPEVACPSREDAAERIREQCRDLASVDTDGEKGDNCCRYEISIDGDDCAAAP